MNLRLALEKDYSQIKELWQYCFDDGTEFVDYYFTNRYNPKNTIVIEEDNRIITSLQMNQYKLNIANKIIPTSYIVGISTLPEKRGSGLMRQILPAALKEIQSRNQSFAIMMAIDSRLYLKYQFGYICEQLSFNFKTADLKQKHHKVSYKRAIAEDRAILKSIYDKRYKDSFLKLARDEQFFSELIRELESEGINLFLVKDDISHEYIGYFTYSIEEDNFYIREWCYLNKKALHSILNFIYQHNMQATTAEIITASNDYLKHITPINKHTEINIFPFIMGRIINVQEFLNFELLRVNDCEVAIKVNDLYLPENNNTYLISVKNNHLTTTLTQKPAQLELGIDTLTQISCGFLSPIISREMNLTEVYDENGFESFREMFGKRDNYLNEYI